MKFLLGSLMVFFATLLAAGLVALGQPGEIGLPLVSLFGTGSGLHPLPSFADWLASLARR